MKNRIPSQNNPDNGGKIRITLTLDPGDDELLAEAARLVRRSRANFILHAAIERAQEVIRQHDQQLDGR